tara:strand:- start:135 stop:386 length:252 start_codon:yes stop_codon:yes gene_type:complete
MLSDSEIEDRNELSPLRKFRLPFVLGDFVLACKLPFLGLGLGMLDGNRLLTFIKFWSGMGFSRVNGAVTVAVDILLLPKICAS